MAESANIPDDVRAAVTGALGSDATIAPMAGGASGARLFAVEAAGARYVARKMGAMAMGEPGKADHELACMRQAADLGVAPRLLHARDGITIMDRVDGAPVRTTAELPRVAATLRALHAGPPFPDTTGPVERIRQLAAMLPVPAELVDSVERVCPLLASLAAPVPCHRDLNPTNILAAPDRVFLIDWELAGNSDAFLDLSQLGIWICRSAAEREELLVGYLGRAPDRTERRRALLARELATGLYAAAFLMFAAFQGKPVPARGPSLREVFATMAASGAPFAADEMARAMLDEHAAASRDARE